MNLNTVNVKMLVFRAGIHKMLFRIANMEDPDQVKKQSGLGHTMQKSTCVVFIIVMLSGD